MLIDAGAFDYAADSWGFTYGAAVEWTASAWTVRGGVFQLSKVPNGKVTSVDFSQFMAVGEVEHHHQWQGHPGKIKALVFINRGRMAAYQDAVQAAALAGGVPDVASVRRLGTRPGAAINIEQEVAPGLGVFLRASMNDGSKEAYEFTEINRSLSTGLALTGSRWNRPDGTLGIAGVVNRLSGAAQDYFTASGIGILIGDGHLRYGAEQIVESYYATRVNSHLTLALDYQHANNPAYNRDRGPVSVYGVRAHLEF